MKILFVQVPTSHLGAGERVYPLGLSRLSSLVPESVEKAVLDMNLCPDPWPVLNDQLKGFRPDIVALSFRNLDPLAGHQTSYISSLKTAAELSRLILPDARIMAGGPAFTLFGERLMQEVPEIDCGIISEAEPVFLKLIEKFFDPGAVAGLIWRKNGKLVSNPMGPKIYMDDIPLMDVTSFRPEDYTQGNKYVAAMGIEGKRGCDLNCGYCIYPCIGGGKIRLRSPVKFVDEMECLSKDHGICMFHFTDSVVNRPVDHFVAICKEITKRNLKVGFTGFFREDTLDASILDIAVKAGLAAIYFSGDALTGHGLKFLNKRLTKDDILNAARMTADNGVLTMCHFLINLPEENEKHFEEAKEMLDEILEIHHSAGNLGAVIFNNVRLYPGAPLTKKLIKRGMLNPDIDLLYPIYYNPPETSHVLHELEAHCHSAGVFSRLGLKK